MTGPEFREQLSDFLEEHLIPQLEGPYQSTDGELRAEFNEEKHCGPNSAVKDRYSLRFSFQGESGPSEIHLDLRHDPVAGCFALWWKDRPSLLLTPRLRAIRTAFGDELNRNLKKYWSKKWKGGPCPACGSALDVHKGNHHFTLRCPKGCVDYCVRD